MKEGTYLVKLSFSDNLTDKHIAVVGNNILNSLIKTVHYGDGIVPDESSAFTEVITVENVETAAFIGKNLCTGDII